MVKLYRGKTMIREGHPILEEHPDLFKEVEVQYDVEPVVEEATAPAAGRLRRAQPAPEPAPAVVAHAVTAQAEAAEEE